MQMVALDRKVIETNSFLVCEQGNITLEPSPNSSDMKCALQMSSHDDVHGLGFIKRPRHPSITILSSINNSIHVQNNYMYIVYSQ